MSPTLKSGQARCRADRWSPTERCRASHPAACLTCRWRIRLLVSLRLSCRSDCRRGQRVHRTASHVSPCAHVTSSRARWPAPPTPALVRRSHAHPNLATPLREPPALRPRPCPRATPKPRGLGLGCVGQLGSKAGWWREHRLPGPAPRPTGAHPPRRSQPAAVTVSLSHSLTHPRCLSFLHLLVPIPNANPLTRSGTQVQWQALWWLLGTEKCSITF